MHRARGHTVPTLQLVGSSELIWNFAACGWRAATRRLSMHPNGGLSLRSKPTLRDIYLPRIVRWIEGGMLLIEHVRSLASQHPALMAGAAIESIACFQTMHSAGTSRHCIAGSSTTRVRNAMRCTSSKCPFRRQRQAQLCRAACSR